MVESITVSAILPASQKRVYEAWLNSREHGEFTGGSANIEPKVGGAFTAWDGYISGRTRELEPFARIIQSWRTTEFPKASPDSQLEVLLGEAKGGTKIALIHTGIPDGQAAEYKKGWEDYYFKPMKEYFARKR